jgi:hypothetical protein
MTIQDISVHPKKFPNNSFQLVSCNRVADPFGYGNSQTGSFMSPLGKGNQKKVIPNRAAGF